VRYETYANQPWTVSRQLQRFLGLENVETIETAPVRKASLGKWKKVLSDTDVEIIRRVSGQKPPR